MVDAKEAYDKMKKTLNENQRITAMVECSKYFAFGISTNGVAQAVIEDSKTVNKETGAFGIMSFEQYVDEVDAGTTNRIDISRF